MIEKLLEFLIGIIDAQLLKGVHLRKIKIIFIIYLCIKFVLNIYRKINDQFLIVIVIGIIYQFNILKLKEYRKYRFQFQCY